MEPSLGGVDPAAVTGSDDGNDLVTVHGSDSDSEGESRCDVAELFSPPRICARAGLWGLIPGFSHDLCSHVDLSTFWGRAQSWGELQHWSPKVLVASPPCTWFSTLQNINQRHYTEEDRTHRDKQAMSLLSFAVSCCKSQYDAGRGFIFEHPWKATRWSAGGHPGRAVLVCLWPHHVHSDGLRCTARTPCQS